ncbi:hypothetical protein Tco_0241861 [Tanacetum coccineum]
MIDDVYISGVRTSGRFRGKRSVVEENAIDEDIDVHKEDIDDDFEPVRYPSKQANGSNGHTKASDIFTADLKHLRMKCQTNSKAKNCCVYAMRHMKTYMINTSEKFECGLDVEGRKQKGQINKLRIDQWHQRLQFQEHQWKVSRLSQPEDWIDLHH